MPNGFMYPANKSGGGGAQIYLVQESAVISARGPLTIDCTAIPGYQNLTADNFCLNITSVYENGAYWDGRTFNVTKSYDPVTGALSITKDYLQAYGWTAINYTFDVYCFVGDKIVL